MAGIIIRCVLTCLITGFILYALTGWAILAGIQKGPDPLTPRLIGFALGVLVGAIALAADEMGVALGSRDVGFKVLKTGVLLALLASVATGAGAFALSYRQDPPAEKYEWVIALSFMPGLAAIIGAVIRAGFLLAPVMRRVVTTKPEPPSTSTERPTTAVTEPSRHITDRIDPMT